MPRIGGRDYKTFFQMAQERLFAHDAQYPLVIEDLPLASERMRHAPVAIAWKFQDDLFNLIAQGNLFRIIFGMLQMFIVPAPTEAKQLAEPLKRQFWMDLMGLRHHGMTLRDAMLCNASG